MMEHIPYDNRFSGWVVVNDSTGKMVFYGHRDDMPDMVADMHVGKIEATYVWEADMYAITVNTRIRVKEER